MRDELHRDADEFRVLFGENMELTDLPEGLAVEAFVTTGWHHAKPATTPEILYAPNIRVSVKDYPKMPPGFFPSTCLEIDRMHITHSRITIGDMAMPDTMTDAAAGRRFGEIVSHPWTDDTPLADLVLRGAVSLTQTFTSGGQFSEVRFYFETSPLNALNMRRRD